MRTLLFKYFSAVILSFITWTTYSQDRYQKYSIDFCGATFNFTVDSSLFVNLPAPLTEQNIKTFYSTINAGKYLPLIKDLTDHKQKYQLNDWLYYQLIRRTAQQISPKADNYNRYTLYKWFLLAKSGYDARLTIADHKLLFYVRSDEDISDIPFYVTEGRQYICLNIHDFEAIDLKKNKLDAADIVIPEAVNAFSYRITQMPDFALEDYTPKELRFNYKQRNYNFQVMINPQVKNIFTNYPVVNFETYFNIPLSRQTYNSLIPALKNVVKKMNQKKGVDYLMRFTRNAFLYESDEANFGKEKRLSPELTLFYEHSDCDDRAALFFYLVKEIYNLPMIALLYPTHITMAVQFDKPLGNSIVYAGRKFSICEPTPQNQDLRIGQTTRDLHAASYQVVYEYDPRKRL